MKATHRIFIILAVILILGDLGISFVQHYHMPLDGDMAVTILPSREYKPVFSDPLGLDAAIKQEEYIHPNRYFLMAFRSKYFKSVPFVFQTVLSPISSVFLACALIKTLMQALILLLMGKYIQIALGGNWKAALAAMLLLTPLFQTLGFYGSMGVIDWAVTYSFSYAGSVVLLLAYFFPFYKAWMTGQSFKIKSYHLLLYVPAAVILPLSGSLINGVTLIICLFIFIHFAVQFIRQLNTKNIAGAFSQTIRTIPKPVFTFLAPMAVVCLYSLYIGRYDLENLTHTLPIADRYDRLPTGLGKAFSRDGGLNVLTGLVVINALILGIWHQNLPAGIKRVMKWGLIFSVVYIILLPLGGYRNYRRFIVRHDSFLPVTIVLMFLYTLTTLVIIKYLSGTARKIYLILPIAAFVYFTINDKPDFDRDSCQRASLRQIAAAQEGPIVLTSKCTVLSWTRRDNGVANGHNSALLEMWGITGEYVEYYHEK